MLTIKRKLILGLCSLALLACQSTTAPDWYSAPPTNDPQYLTAVGQGLNLTQAKQSALSQINAQLWTQINSSFVSRDIVQSRNQSEHASSLIDNHVNSKTANITLTGIDYPQVAKNDIGYYVQAKVSRDTVVRQLRSEIEQSNRHAQAVLQQRQHQDALLWWLANRAQSEQAQAVAVRQAMLRALGQDDIPKAESIDQLASALAQVQSGIVIRVSASRKDQKSAELLAEQFSKQSLKTTFSGTPNTTHVLKLTSQLRQSTVGQAYISTQFTTLKLQGRNGNILASHEIISSGNSLTNYTFSKEGAERNFADTVSAQGLWTSLGIQ
ncbi:LPP20 family lipoprotein [Vibrio ostreae]|uniref:LPP20 family lipoprotein n=1 Tax=Vibrio ostreae TaxID=2841925 RepID=A0A975YN29_9VIBR|nr:LPP20 family lipoprotein [Vibrio ostreae]QXO17224.1 LPP20 family lipoprotein [Vibrio ostreae]